MSADIPLSIMRKMTKYPAFYRKVWEACARIPAGKTLSYGELAALIGHPKAARAVGQALARNPFAPVIPCHRVIRSDGKMGGYSAPGGIRKKLRMLAKERK
ncbi:MAG: methylated-DNA--[protein]-cysteine S-methyltransferase [Endomicrobiales bacterium]